MKTVLVVEDERDIANMFLYYLRDAVGYAVNMIHHGVEAYDALSGPDPMPDAILLDMHLPGKSGAEIYCMLKERGYASRTLLCSADIGLVSKYQSEGALAITKPVMLSDLREIVVQMTGGVT